MPARRAACGCGAWSACRGTGWMRRCRSATSENCARAWAVPAAGCTFSSGTACPSCSRICCRGRRCWQGWRRSASWRTLSARG
ncbi:hypothetical protein DW923_13640, partial [Butyricicoccus sp. AM42-5AC]